jgi:hypothetical protein
LQLLSQRRIFFQDIAENFFVAMITINVSVIEGGNAGVQGSFNEQQNLAFFKIPTPGS